MVHPEPKAVLGVLKADDEMRVVGNVAGLFDTPDVCGCPLLWQAGIPIARGRREQAGLDSILG